MLTSFHKLDHHHFMSEALIEAEKAGKRGDRAIGSIIVHQNKIIAKGSNQIESADNNLIHAEIDAMTKCASYLRKHARECVIYTTVEPCIMCLSSIVMANIRSIVFATEDRYMNMKPFIQSNPYIEKRIHNYLGGIQEERSIGLLKKYSPETAEIVLHGHRM